MSLGYLISCKLLLLLLLLLLLALLPSLSGKELLWWFNRPSAFYMNHVDKKVLQTDRQSNL